MHTVKQINGAILWANLHLLFWLSLIPFATAWLGENYFASFPIAYFILQNLIIKDGKNAILSKALGKDFKGKSSPVFYIIAVIFANYYPTVSGAIYIFVALMWLVPDQRIERIFNNESE